MDTRSDRESQARRLAAYERLMSDGFVERAVGSPKKAEQSYRKALRIAEQLVECSGAGHEQWDRLEYVEPALRGLVEALQLQRRFREATIAEARCASIRRESRPRLLNDEDLGLLLTDDLDVNPCNVPGSEKTDNDEAWVSRLTAAAEVLTAWPATTVAYSTAFLGLSAYIFEAWHQHKPFSDSDLQLAALVASAHALQEFGIPVAVLSLLVVWIVKTRLDAIEAR